HALAKGGFDPATRLRQDAQVGVAAAEGTQIPGGIALVGEHRAYLELAETGLRDHAGAEDLLPKPPAANLLQLHRREGAAATATRVAQRLARGLEAQAQPPIAEARTRTAGKGQTHHVRRLRGRAFRPVEVRYDARAGILQPRRLRVLGEHGLLQQRVTTR